MPNSEMIESPATDVLVALDRGRALSFAHGDWRDFAREAPLAPGPGGSAMALECVAILLLA